MSARASFLSIAQNQMHRVRASCRDGNELDTSGFASLLMRFDHDLDILIERHEKAKKALHRKLPEFAAQHLRNIGLAYADQTGRLDLFQSALLQNRVDFEDELRLDAMFVCFRLAEIIEHVPAADLLSPFVHGSSSAIRKHGGVFHASAQGLKI